MDFIQQHAKLQEEAAAFLIAIMAKGCGRLPWAGSESAFQAAVAESGEAILWERLESEKLKVERRRLDEAEKDLETLSRRTPRHFGFGFFARPSC